MVVLVGGFRGFYVSVGTGDAETCSQGPCLIGEKGRAWELETWKRAAKGACLIGEKGLERGPEDVRGRR